MTSIKSIHFMVLGFPVSHYISGWRLVASTQHLITVTVLDDGSVGFGEGTPYWTSIFDDYRKAFRISKKVVGVEVRDALSILREEAYRDFSTSSRINYGAYLSLETSVLDALAKSKKTPIAQLLGGLYRTTIPVVGTIFLKHPKLMALEVERWYHLGVKHLKLKIPCDLQGLEQVLSEVNLKLTEIGADNVTIRVDANECFKDIERAVKALHIMARYNVNVVEQPMPRDSLAEIAELRKRFYPEVMFMLDESLKKPEDIERFAEMEVVDVVNFHPSKLGCLTITRETILKAQRLGLKTQIGSALMTEIGLTHYLNLAASIPILDYPLEELGLANYPYGYSILDKPDKYAIRNGGNITVSPRVPIPSLKLIKPFSLSDHQTIEKYIRYIVKSVIYYPSKLILLNE